VAQWQYRIERLKLGPGTTQDSQLEDVLREYGQQGWELVDVMQETDASSGLSCRLILKTEKPLD